MDLAKEIGTTMEKVEEKAEEKADKAQRRMDAEDARKIELE